MSRRPRRPPKQRKPRSVEEPVRELKRLMLQRAEAPLSARLVSQPPAAAPGTVVSFVATVFGDRGALSHLDPVLRCVQLGPSTGWPMPARRVRIAGGAEFVAKVSTEGFAPDSYHFSVHPTPDAEDALAQCTLHVLSQASFDAALNAPLLVFGLPFHDDPDPKPRRRRARGPAGGTRGGSGSTRRR